MTLRNLISKLERISTLSHGKLDDYPIHAVGNNDMIDMDVIDAVAQDGFVEIALR